MIGDLKLDRRGVTWGGVFLSLLVIPSLLLGAVAEAQEETRPSKGRFLVAARDLRDPNFAQTVVLLVHYDAQGAMGLIVNRPTGRLAGELLPELQELASEDQAIFLGGPVGRYGLLALLEAREPPVGAEHIFGDIYLSGGRDLMQRTSTAAGKRSRLRVYVGHAGWAPGQLDFEIARGGWHVVPARRDLVFAEDPAEMWEQLIPPESKILSAGLAER